MEKINIKEIEKEIEKYDDTKVEKVNWTKVWSKKYPILEEYQKEIEKLLDSLEKEYNYNKLDAMLVLKDILAKTYFANK